MGAEMSQGRFVGSELRNLHQEAWGNMAIRESWQALNLG
jgi:hypothetical protein